MAGFELFMGYKGNGCTVANMAVMEHGDYKRIAHISNGGIVKWYVPAKTVPDDAMSRIMAAAGRHRQRFDDWFDLMLKHHPGTLYAEILSTLSFDESHRHIMEHPGLGGTKERCESLRELYRQKY